MYTIQESRPIAEKPHDAVVTCEIQYVSKFTAASRGSRRNSTAFLLLLCR